MYELKLVSFLLRDSNLLQVTGFRVCPKFRLSPYEIRPSSYLNSVHKTKSCFDIRKCKTIKQKYFTLHSNCITVLHFKPK